MTKPQQTTPIDPFVAGQITEFVRLGYNADHLIVSDSGRVFFDPEKADLEAHLRVFGSDAQPANEQCVR